VDLSRSRLNLRPPKVLYNSPDRTEASENWLGLADGQRQCPCRNGQRAFSPAHPEVELLFIRRQGVERFISSSNGEFSFRLPSDSYRIQVKAKGFEPLETNTTVAAGMASLRLVLKRGDDLAVGFHLNLAIVERARIGAGVVQPVAGAQVHISQFGREIESGISQRAGQYTAHVKPGVVAIRVDKLGYATANAEVVVSNSDVNHQIILNAKQEDRRDAAQQSTLTVRVSQRIAQTTHGD